MNNLCKDYCGISNIRSCKNCIYYDGCKYDFYDGIDISKISDKTYIFENKKMNIDKFIAIIVLILILIATIIYLSNKHSIDAKKWNEGYCPDCGGEYSLVDISYIRYIGNVYYYTCDNCGKIIELYSAPNN